MEDVILRADVGNGKTIFISPLSARAAREGGGKGLGGDYGYFVYQTNAARPDDIEIFAKTASSEAALRLFDLIKKR